MPRPADFFADLRAADEHLAALTPGAHVEARLRARLRDETPSSSGPFGGFGLRLRRPLILAFAIAAGALYVIVDSGPPKADNADAAPSAPSVPVAPPEAIPERIAAPAAPPDPTLDPHRARTPRVIHAPALEEKVPLRRDGDPPPRHPFAAPPSAPSGAPVPERPIFDSNSNAPATPIEPRKEHLSPVAPSRGRIFGGPPSPTPSGATPVAAPAGYSRPSQSAHSFTPSSSPGGASGNEATDDCKSTGELIDEGRLRCTQQGLVLSQVSYLSWCGDGRFRDVEVQCHEEEEESKPEPEPEACFNHAIGDGTTCAGDLNSLKQQTADACSQSGLMLTDLQLVADGCSANQFLKAVYTCCNPQALPEPPVDSCAGGELGDGAICLDDLSYKQAADLACKQAGLALVAVKVTSDCAGGQSTKAYYECCSASTKP